MLISHSKKLVVFTPSRTASSSVHVGLGSYFDVVIFKEIDRSNTWLTKHCKAKDFVMLCEPLLPNKNYYKIAIVRDPVERLSSMYKTRGKFQYVDSDFDTFCKSLIEKEKKLIKLKQFEMLSVNGKLYLDRIFAFEKLNLFEQFLSTVFDDEIKLPFVHVSPQVDFTIKDSTRDYIYRHLHEDVELHQSVLSSGGELIINPYQSNS
jgi:hypothetical protein